MITNKCNDCSTRSTTALINICHDFSLSRWQCEFFNGETSEETDVEGKAEGLSEALKLGHVPVVISVSFGSA